MKIQELAIIFIIIILPISLLLSAYTQFQIKTINLQTLYDSNLNIATYDAIRAFQINSTNSTTSDLANSKLRDIEASISTFRNSMRNAFGLNGYTEDALNNYIPALVYTLYDGFYIYSPYENVNYKEDAGEKVFGLKPYINYSCRYVRGTTIDVIITYSLDNYITVRGMVDGVYVNKSGYLIDNIKVNGDEVTYNGVPIGTERLKENLNGTLRPYVKINGTKYYLIEEENRIVYILNGKMMEQCKDGDLQYNQLRDKILNNNSAKQYYKNAYNFTEWFKTKNLNLLTYGNAKDQDKFIWSGNNTKIFNFNSSTTDFRKNIENELSSFNEHRLAVIRYKIETNLAIAISNYNEYSGAATNNVFQMPKLKENEWDNITHNISLISFLQGLSIGGKIYNGYSLVTNSESKEVVLENNIYILGSDGYYHKIGDKGFENGGTINVDAGDYGDSGISAGRLNLDFERTIVEGKYYYPLKDYNASYDSIIMQNKVNTYDDIYAYVNAQKDDLKKAFYTALGRERQSMYRSENKT